MKRALRRVFASMVIGLIVGCGDANLFDGLSDSNTPDATLEAARIAIDHGEFTAAIALLEQLCGTNLSVLTCDAETAALMASAYAGRAGLNVFAVIENAGNLPAGTAGSFASFSTLFPSPTAADKTDLHVAVSILANLSAFTPDQSLELAIMALADIVVTIGVDLTGGFDAATGLPTVLPATVTDVQNAQASYETLTQVTNDLGLVDQGVAGAGLAGQEIVGDITQIQSVLDLNLSGVVTDQELYDFLVGL